ncbi:MAG: hypothetical protein B7Z05_07250 [Thiotrichales bacterium 32-46-8]|nr:MAG: hypothetical protein B7Z05_07250 [Thiotrichales bacterium 32-46-8]
MLSAFSVVARASRPAFLLLTPVVLFLAAALAWQQSESLRWDLLPWLLVSALCAAIASNLLNEYFDFSSGLDHQTQATPFSGGSKALIEAPHRAELVKWAGLLSVSLSTWSGLYLVAQVGWPLLLLGLLGVGLIIAYPPILNRFPWLCLLARGLGYGLVMFLGAYWVLLGQVSWQGGWLMLLPLSLVSALLLMNQFPDAEADAQVGRRHAVIAWGRERAYALLAGLHAISYLLLWMLAWQSGFSLLAWALVWLPVSLVLLWQGKAMMQGETVLPAMALNVILVLGLPITVALLLIASKP